MAAWESTETADRGDVNASKEEAGYAFAASKLKLAEAKAAPVTNASRRSTCGKDLQI
jgi:hypothetical protein